MFCRLLRKAEYCSWYVEYTRLFKRGGVVNNIITVYKYYIHYIMTCYINTAVFTTTLIIILLSVLVYLFYFFIFFLILLLLIIINDDDYDDEMKKRRSIYCPKYRREES